MSRRTQYTQFERNTATAVRTLDQRRWWQTQPTVHQRYRQSKTQTAKQRSQTQANSPPAANYMDYSLSITTNMPRWHSLRAHGLYRPIPLCPQLLISFSPYLLPKIPASAACLNTCNNRPSHPVDRLPITSDRTRESTTVHNWHHTWTRGPPPPPKIGRRGHYWPRRLQVQLAAID